jgi:nucleotide-binding universal stress UspA family protein
MTPAKIFVATDLSEPSAVALREAHARVARGGELLVGHVVPSWRRANALFPQFNEPRLEAERARLDDARQALTAFVSATLGSAAGHYSVAVEEGDPATEIIRMAEKWNADLTVIGSHGSTGLPRIRLGGVAENIVRHAHGRVLVARPPSGTRTIVVGTDFSDASLPALHAAVDEARRVDGRAIFAHSVEWPLVLDAQYGGWAEIDAATILALESDARKRLEDFAAASGIPAECRVLRGEAGRTLIREAESARADLVVVGTHGRTALSRMVLGSVAEFVVRTAHCSVLVVRLRKP